jgi:hypothetical protein
LKQPTAAVISIIPLMSMKRGSDASRIRERDVNSLVVSRAVCSFEEIPM